MKHIETAGVIERVERVQAFRQSDMSGAGDMAIISFEAEIGYVVEQHVEAHTEHGGERMEVISGYIDLGRFGNCVKSLSGDIDREVAQFCRKFSITQDSSLQVVIVAKQIVTPILLKPGSIEKGVFGRMRYTVVPSDWSSNHSSLQLMIDYESGASRKRPEDEGARFKPTFRAREVIWRSNWTEEQNAEARGQYIAKYIDSVVEVKPDLVIPSQKMVG